MQIDWTFQEFNSLSPQELYEILYLRISVFMIEQKCLYSECDNNDQVAYHLCGRNNGKLALYARVIPPNIYYHGETKNLSRIGRVVTSPDYRRKKLGHKLIQKAIDATHKKFPDTNITLSAQTHLRSFYESHGFSINSEEFIEDGIPHIKMIRNQKCA